MHEIVSFSKEIEFRNMINKITSISLEHTLMLDSKSNIKGDFIVSGSYKMTAATQIESDFSYKIPVDIEIDEKYDLSNLLIDIDDFTYEVVNEEILKVDIALLLDRLELKKEEMVESLVDENNLDELEKLEDLFLECEDKKDLEIKNDDDIEILDIASAIEENKDDDRCIEEVDEYNLNIAEKKEVKNDEENVLEKKDREEAEYDNMSLIDSKAELMKEIDDNVSLFSSFDSSSETYSTYSVYIVRDGDSVEEILNKYKISRDALESYNDLSNLKIGTKVIIPSATNE